MARILVAGADASLAQRRLLHDLVERLRQDGHDAALWRTAEEGPARSIRDADAMVAVLDDLPADVAAAIALADTLDKPCLGLATGKAAPLFAKITQPIEAEDEADWWAALPGFYDRIRPFAGRVVRDRIPDLVRQAGHDVQFRSLSADERPRFLKQKIANEARELLSADLAKEKEEVADVLEALEAFILARGFERDDLRRVKEHKKKQRGGFERAFVVEATSRAQLADGPSNDGAGRPAAPSDARRQAPAPQAGRDGGQKSLRDTERQPATGSRAPHPSAAPTTRHATPPGGAPAHPSASPGVATPSAPAGVTTGDDIDFEYSESDREPVQVDDIASGRDVKGKFFEI